MNQRLAILDLGTNTFHLLIAEVKPDRSFSVLCKEEEFVKLGEDGLDKIGNRAFERAVAQAGKFKLLIEKFQPQQVIGFGTAAIRRASNGDELIAALKNTCTMEVRKISGDEEAELIYLGVRQAVKLDAHPVLIMDIGGGSTELIIANHETIFWKKSFPLGASLLKKQFHFHEPISASEQVHLLNLLQKELEPLAAEMQKYSVKHLVGASGSFDTLAHLTAENFYGQSIHPAQSATEIPHRDVYRLIEILIGSTLEQRLEMKGMLWFRAEMMVVAAILAGYIVETYNIRRITRSAYALKEGVLWKMIQSLN